MPQCEDGRHWSASGGDTPVFRGTVCLLAVARGECWGAECGLEAFIAGRNVRRFDAPGRFVGIRANACPRRGPAQGFKDGHVRTDFGDDQLGDEGFEQGPGGDAGQVRDHGGEF